MLKSKTVIGLAAITLSAGILIGSVSDAATPGSATDPLVSKSYVDEKFNQLTTMINNISVGTGSGSSGTVDKDVVINEVMAQIQYLYGSGSLGTESEKFVPVELKAGQILFGGESTEIIFRTGSAVAYITGLNGITDVTDGIDIMNNAALKANHHLIVPRDDGRGVKAKTDSWFMVKGSYTITAN